MTTRAAALRVVAPDRAAAWLGRESAQPETEALKQPAARAERQPMVALRTTLAEATKVVIGARAVLGAAVVE